MAKYDIFFEEEFEKKKGWFGNDLSKYLIDNFGLSADAARKVIQRKTQAKVIRSSKPLTFGFNQYYYFSSDNQPTRLEYKNLLEKKRPPVFRLLDILDQVQILTFFEALKITSSTDDKATTKVSRLMDIANELGKSHLIVERKDNNGVNYILNKINDASAEVKYEILQTEHKERLKIDTIFNMDLVKWLYETNIISSYGNFRSLSNPAVGVEFNHLYWDAIAYSNTTGIYNREDSTKGSNGKKQVPVLIDILIYTEYSISHLNSFISRVQINENSVTTQKRRSIPIIIYNTIDSRALNTAKKCGFLVYSLGKIYGNMFSKLLVDINSVFSKINSNASDIEKALEKIQNSGHNTELSTLRGILFETLMNPVLKSIYPNSRTFSGKILKNKSKKQREFDLIIDYVNKKELVLVELKGYSGNSYIKLGKDGNDKSTLRYFFNGSVPLAKECYKEDYLLRGYTTKAMFITTGNFHSESNEYRTQINASNLMPSIICQCTLDGNDLITLLQEYGFNREVKIIKEYYIDIQDESERLVETSPSPNI